MKKLLTILIALMLILSACGKSTEKTKEDSSMPQNSIEQKSESKMDDNDKPEEDSDKDSSSVATESSNEEIPKEYKSALAKAEIYSDTMHMSKAGIFDQLTADAGEGFSKEAATYALDNLEADYKANALEKAKVYQDSMNMSPKKIYEQLVSEYGEKFTEEEAQYAVDNLPK